jgi:hypothetical protein
MWTPPNYPEDWPLPWCNEAETGLLALRLTGSPFKASSKRITPFHARLATCRMGNYMMSSFQLTRSTRLGLAHRMDTDNGPDLWLDFVADDDGYGAEGVVTS